MLEVHDSVLSLSATDGHLDGNFVFLPEACRADYRLEHVAHQLQESIALRSVLFAAAGSQLARSLGFGDVCPNAACVEHGTPLELIGASIRSPTFLQRLDLESWVRNECQNVSVGFANELDQPVKVYWIDPENEERSQPTNVVPGYDNVHWRRSLLGHRFEVVAASGQTLQTVIASYDAVNVIRRSSLRMMGSRNWTKLIENTDKSELRRAGVVRRTFTDNGFAVAPVPDEIWARTCSTLAVALYLVLHGPLGARDVSLSIRVE